MSRLLGLYETPLDIARSVEDAFRCSGHVLYTGGETSILSTLRNQVPGLGPPVPRSPALAPFTAYTLGTPTSASPATALLCWAHSDPQDAVPGVPATHEKESERC